MPTGKGCAAKAKTLFVFAVFLCLGLSEATAAIRAKANNTTNLNRRGAWSGNVKPGSADIAQWTSTVTGANTVGLGGNISWLGIQITNPGGAVTIKAGSTLTLGSSGINMAAATQNLTLNCALMLGSAQVWDVTTGRALAASGVIGGTGSLTKNGLGTLTLTGANTYTGATNINAGTLAISTAAGLGASSSITTINAGTLNLLTGQTVTSSRQVKLGNVGSTIQVDAGSSFTLSGVIGNGASSGNLIKTGAGTVVLSAAAGNSYGGAGHTTSINAGTLQVSAENQLGNIANTVTFNGGTLLFGSGFTSTRGVSLSSVGTINTNNNAPVLSGVVSGAGGLTKTGAGTLTLSGTNTYSGGTSITGGNTSVISVSSASNLGSGALTISGGSVLASNAVFTLGIGVVLGAPGGGAQADGNPVSGIFNVAAGTTLTLSGAGISESVSGTGRFEKLGAGTLIMTTANSYSGGTYIHEGTFVFANSLALGPQPSNNPTFNQLTIDNGAQLMLSTGGAFRRNVLVGTGGALFGATTAGNIAYRNGVFSNVSGQVGGVTTSSGVNGFGGANSYNGNLVINNGSIAAISRDVNLGGSANQILLNGGGVLRVEDGVDITASGGTSAITILATFSSNRQITLGAGNGTTEVKNFADTNPSFDVSGSNPIVPAGGRPVSHLNTLTWNGQLTGPGGLIKTGNGTLVMGNATNNYTGGTTINGGILSLADPAALGSGSSALTINPTGIFQATSSFSTSRPVILGGSGGASGGGTFDVTGTNNEIRTGVISGSGSLTKTGSGTLTLDAANTFTGDLYLNGGTISSTSNLSLGPQPTAGSSLYALHMANGTTLQSAAGSFSGHRRLELVSGTATVNMTVGSSEQRDGLVYGAGGLAKAGAGTIILTNANTYSGGTSIGAGTLQVNNSSGSGTGSGAVAVHNGGVLSGLPAMTGFSNPGSISGTVSVNSGGAIRARSGGTFTFGGLTLNAAAISNFEIGAATSTAVISITGVNGLSLGGLSTVNISNAGGLAAGTYHLFDYAGTALANIANLQLGGTAGGGFTYSLSNNQTNTSIDLIVSLSNQQWGNDADGNWSVASNWTDGAAPNSVGAQANFFGLINQARTVTVNGAFTIGNMTFNDSDSYTIAGSGVGGQFLTLNNGSTAAIGVAAGNHTISAPLTLASDLHLTAAAGTSLTVSGTMTESGGARTVTSNGAGNVTLAGGGANTYTGLTTVSAGTVSLNKTAGVNAIGSGGLEVRPGAAVTLLASNQIADTASVIANGTFGLASFSETIAALNGTGSVTTAVGGTLTVGASNNLDSEFSGVISGTGTIAKAGSGTFMLGGANTFGGSGQTVTVSGGTLSVGLDGNLGNAANSLTLNNGSLAFTSGFATNRAVNLTGNGTIITDNVAATFTNAISGAGSLTKAGAGTLTLSGTNSYAGGTFITGGNSSALSISSAANLGSGAVTVIGGSSFMTSASFTLANNFTLGATGGGNQGDGQAVSGIFNVASGTTLIQNASSVISGGRLMKDGAGTLDLRGSNSYTGGTYLHNGTLVINSGTSFGQRPTEADPFFAALTIDNGATLRAGVSLVAVPGRGLLIGTGGGVLEVNAAITYFRNGPMANVSGQSGGLTKVGVGVMGLGGTNTFTGNVQVNSGVLSISRDANLGSASNQLFLADGTTFRIEDGLDNYGASPSTPVLATFTTNRQVNLLGGSATFEVKNYADTNLSFGTIAAPASHLNTLTVGGFLTGAGSLVKSGDGTLVLTNTANNFTGSTVINGGVLSVANPSALGLNSIGLAINNHATFQITGSSDTPRTTSLGGTGGPAGVGGGIIDVTSGVEHTRRGVISGAGSLTKTGSGTLNLNADNTFAGGTFVNAGTLAIDRNTSLGLASGSATIGNATLQVTSDVTTTRNLALSNASSTLRIDDGATYVVNGVISGAGVLNKTGEGTLAPTGTNTYSGGTNINGGTFVANTDRSLGATGTAVALNAGTLEIANGFSSSRNLALGSLTSMVQVNAAQTYVASGAVTGTGSLNKTGSGTLTLTSANNFTGETIVDDGTLNAAASTGSALATTTAITVNGSGTLLLGASNQINNAAPITLDGGTLAKGNFSEGATSSRGLGALTLTSAGSLLDFGLGTVGVLSFASFIPGADSDFESLLIANWTGLSNTVGSGSTDRLIFNESQAANLSYFSFAGFADGATQFNLGGGFYEVVPVMPVPEPATYLAGAITLLACGYQQRRRLRGFFRRRS